MNRLVLSSVVAFAATLLCAQSASAQTGGWTTQPNTGQPTQQYPPWTTPATGGGNTGYGTGYNTGYGTGTGTGYTNPQPTTGSGSNKNSSEIEIGILYGTAAAYGAGVGIWFDSEAKIDDPGLKFIAPVTLGLAAPVGVYFLDHPPMPRGMPAAISAGLFLGAAEGMGIWSYQFTSSTEDNQWGFRGLSRAMTLGSTLGGVGGFALGYYQEPSPKSSLLISSSGVWGAVIGSMIGYGSTEKDRDFGDVNEGASIGGLVGFNLAVAGTAGLSMVYTPSWTQIGWMWAGGGIGAAVGLPVYLMYAGSEDHPAKRGLIFQGITTALGIAAGGVFASGIKDDFAKEDRSRPQFASITGLGLLPVQGGAGVQMMGLLF